MIKCKCNINRNRRVQSPSIVKKTRVIDASFSENLMKPKVQVKTGDSRSARPCGQLSMTGECVWAEVCESVAQVVMQQSSAGNDQNQVLIELVGEVVSNIYIALKKKDFTPLGI